MELGEIVLLHSQGLILLLKCANWNRLVELYGGFFSCERSEGRGEYGSCQERVKCSALLIYNVGRPSNLLGYQAHGLVKILGRQSGCSSSVCMWGYEYNLLVFTLQIGIHHLSKIQW